MEHTRRPEGRPRTRAGLRWTRLNTKNTCKYAKCRTPGTASSKLIDLLGINSLRPPFDGPGLAFGFELAVETDSPVGRLPVDWPFKVLVTCCSATLNSKSLTPGSEETKIRSSSNRTLTFFACFVSFCLISKSLARSTPGFPVLR